MNQKTKLGDFFSKICLKLKLNNINFKNINPQKLKTIILFIYSFLLLSTIYHVIYANRIIPGVRVAGVKVGGMTFNQAKNALEKKDKETTKDLKLKYDDKEFLIRAQDIGLVYDWDASVSRSFEVGRNGNLISDSKEKVAGLFKSLVVPASYDYDDDSLGIKLSIIRGEVNKESIQANVVLTDGNLTVSSSEKGRKIIEDDLYSAVIGSFDSLSFSDKNVPIKIVNPQIVEKDLNDFLDKVKKIISQDLVLKYEDKTWTIGKLQLLDLISFEKVDGKVRISLNDAKFEAIIENISGDVNILPRGQVTSSSGNTVLEFKIIKDGKELAISKFREDFKDSMFGERVVVNVSVEQVTGPSDKEKYGIFALLGEGVSHYAGSIPGRVHNLTLAAERTNGVLVAPGATYSLNNSVGDIDAAHGFEMAYIIKGGRTVLGEGGGVCQTSTTLFRAVLNAGLPVVARYPHAYRVGYYEQDQPVGFDAAIFQPSWDFKFKNNTDAYVLVQTSWDVNENSLTFKLYGTPDGRTVEITKPVITNQSPPPEPVYQDDPTLKEGTIVQVEHPAWGASVSFSRTVKKGNDILFTDTFDSRYQPWRAIFLRGTKK
jgi:vancomycin resistance protein YoaR